MRLLKQIVAPGLFFLMALIDPNTTRADEAQARAIIDGIFGKSPASLETMDLYPDGRIDVADVLRAAVRTESPISFLGHRWLVGVRYYQVGVPAGAGLGVQNQVPVNLTFALDAKAAPVAVTVATFTSASPANNILWQTLPQDSQPYALNRVMPTGMAFSYSEQAGMVVLDSPRVAMAGNDPVNPTGRPLWRQWTLRIDPQRLAQGELDSGEITERIGGYLPGDQSLTVQGIVSLTQVDNP